MIPSLVYTCRDFGLFRVVRPHWKFQFQCTYFYRTARLWNTLPFVIRDASSLQIFKKNLNELYLAMVNLFDVNNRCTWSLACACVNCQI